MEINFDEASIAWRENKRYKGKGFFTYRCEYIHSDGKHCNRDVYSQTTPKYATHPQWTGHRITSDTYCKQHMRRAKFLSEPEYQA